MREDWVCLLILKTSLKICIPWIHLQTFSEYLSLHEVVIFEHENENNVKVNVWWFATLHLSLMKGSDSQKLDTFIKLLSYCIITCISLWIKLQQISIWCSKTMRDNINTMPAETSNKKLFWKQQIRVVLFYLSLQK